MSGGTFVPRNECPGGHFFQGDSHSSDTGVYIYTFILYLLIKYKTKIIKHLYSNTGDEPAADLKYLYLFVTLSTCCASNSSPLLKCRGPNEMLKNAFDWYLVTRLRRT